MVNRQVLSGCPGNSFGPEAAERQEIRRRLVVDRTVLQAEGTFA